MGFCWCVVGWMHVGISLECWESALTWVGLLTGRSGVHGWVLGRGKEDRFCDIPIHSYFNYSSFHILSLSRGIICIDKLVYYYILEIVQENPKWEDMLQLPPSAEELCR